MTFTANGKCLIHVRNFSKIIENVHLRKLDWIFLGGYLPSLSINYVAMNKDMEKKLP